MLHDDGTYAGMDGVKLYYQMWRNEGQARSVVAIVHGIGGHSGMFTHAADCLTPRGHDVYALDLRGHGRSSGLRGHVNRWSEYQEDLRPFLQMVHTSNTGLPLSLMGHSLGAVIALDYAINSPAGLAGVITSAAPLGHVTLPAHLLLMSRVLSRVAPRISFSVDHDLSRSSRDPETLDRYAQDPLRHSSGTARLGTEYMAAVERINAGAGRLQVPLMMLHGTGDQIASVEGSRSFFPRVPGQAKEYHEYPGAFHELHNDLNYDQVFADIAFWIEHRPVEV